MLRNLHITNYALIDEVDISFAPGFNAITGETGAGKSIMLGALALILGGRADLKSVVGQGRKSVIEAEFVLDPDDAELPALLAAHDIDAPAGDGDPVVILRRELTPGGRSRAFVNDSPVGLGVLQQVARGLVDIHSQQENQLLADPSFQLRVIDRMAGNDALRDTYAEAYDRLRRAVKRLRVAQARVTRRTDEEEHMRHALAEIRALRLHAGEQAELEAELAKHDNLTFYKEHMTALLQALAADESGAIELLNGAAAHAAEVADLLDAGADNLRGRLDSAIIELRDIADGLADIDASLEADPRRRDQVADRLSAIYTLQRRHAVDNVEGLLALADRLKQELDELDNSDSAIAALKEEARNARKAAADAAGLLTASRRDAAARFAADLRATAAPLGMPNLVVDIRVEPAELGVTGADRVDFLFAFNKNQLPVPVAGAASGGEVSRLMLSVKSLIAGRMRLPAIIFDEVDTGVSGQVAAQMGSMMVRMARTASDGRGMQVIAITHLPQVAAQAGAHFKVYKADSDVATHTHISRLDPAGRVDELALMLSGDPSLPSARETAATLLNGRG